MTGGPLPPAGAAAAHSRRGGRSPAFNQEAPASAARTVPFASTLHRARDRLCCCCSEVARDHDLAVERGKRSLRWLNEKRVHDFAPDVDSQELMEVLLGHSIPGC